MSLLSTAFLLASIHGSMVNPMLLIVRGEFEMKVKNWSAAESNFERAIPHLNMPDRTMAYWNLFYVRDHMPDKKIAAASALFGFIVTGDEIIDSIKYLPSDHPIKQWERNNRIKDKLMFAKVNLEAIWAGMSPILCRSKVWTCYCPQKRFLKLYEKSLPFCSKDYTVSTDGYLTTVIVKCDGSDEVYYFATDAAR